MREDTRPCRFYPSRQHAPPTAGQADPLAPITWGAETASPHALGVDRTATASAPVLLDATAVVEPADASAPLKPTTTAPLDRLEPAVVTEYLQGAIGTVRWRRSLRAANNRLPWGSCHAGSRSTVSATWTVAGARAGRVLP